jgi:hypothetical protein
MIFPLFQGGRRAGLPGVKASLSFMACLLVRSNFFLRMVTNATRLTPSRHLSCSRGVVSGLGQFGQTILEIHTWRPI